MCRNGFVLWSPDLNPLNIYLLMGTFELGGVSSKRVCSLKGLRDRILNDINHPVYYSVNMGKVAEAKYK